MSSSQLIEEIQTRLDKLKDEMHDFMGQGEIDVDESIDDPVIANVVPPTYPDEEIVGGDETDDFPDCCAVGNAIRGYTCSGTLIAPNVVVSAKHCTDITRVFLKGNNVDVPQDGETIPVVKSYSHPDLDLRVLLLAHDSTVKPRKIAHGAMIRNAKRATVAGFGTIDLHGTVGYGRKRKVIVPIESIDCAAAGEARQHGCLKGFELVAGHRGLLKDSCRGDSGGPLYIQDHAGDYFLLGATSRGVRSQKQTCGDGGIYVRVDLCMDWIKKVTSKEVAKK